MCAPGNDKAVVLGKFITKLGNRAGFFLVIHVAQALEKQQWEDELFVVARVDKAAQERRRAPQVRFEFRLGDGSRLRHGYQTVYR